MQKNTLWLIIWRFQPIHKGHIQLIQKSLEENPATLVLVGSVNKQDNKNPYTFEERRNFILWEFPNKKLSLAPLPDFASDDDWIDHILLHIPERVTDASLYCGDRQNDYAVQVLEKLKATLPFDLEIQEIDRKDLPVSGTQIRGYLRENQTQKLRDSLWNETFKMLKNI